MYEYIEQNLPLYDQNITTDTTNLLCEQLIEQLSRQSRTEVNNCVKDKLNKEEDNDPIGIILCTEKEKVHAEYALAGISNKLFVSKYKLYLPSKEELEKEVKKLL